MSGYLEARQPWACSHPRSSDSWALLRPCDVNRWDCAVLSHVREVMHVLSWIKSPPGLVQFQSCLSVFVHFMLERSECVCFLPPLLFGCLFQTLHHSGLNARLLLVSNSAYSRSFCSHSLMLTKWGCDSICVGCKTGMIVEPGICVFNDAIIDDVTSPLLLSKDDTTYHNWQTPARLPGETGATRDEIYIGNF